MDDDRFEDWRRKKEREREERKLNERVQQGTIFAFCAVLVFVLGLWLSQLPLWELILFTPFLAFPVAAIVDYFVDKLREWLRWRR